MVFKSGLVLNTPSSKNFPMKSIINTKDIILPKLPQMPLGSPKIVLVLDKIRFELEKNGEKYDEFCWFAREFPRYYRYHVDNIKYRLQTISNIYEEAKVEVLDEINTDHGEALPFEFSSSSILSRRAYWDFEALLNATGSALDILARVSGLAYRQTQPPSLNKICKGKELEGIVELFRQAKIEWVDVMKDYRDCFVHYVPVDSLLSIKVYPLNKNWKMWCKIPTNPNARNSLSFVFSRKLDLLRYSITIYKNLMNLDREVSEKIRELYRKGEYPKRINNLFSVGTREK